MNRDEEVIVRLSRRKPLVYTGYALALIVLGGFVLLSHDVTLQPLIGILMTAAGVGLGVRAWLALGGAEPFSAFVWDAVGGAPIQSRLSGPGAARAQTPESAALSKRLAKAGFGFCGPTTVYAFMQAMGMVNDHAPGCATRAQVEQARAAFNPPR